MSVQVNFNFQRNVRSSTPKKLVRTSDGDTTLIVQAIRMVSCDTPEKAPYAGKPETSQPKLDKCRERLKVGFYNMLTQELRNYLIEMLTNITTEDQISSGNDATKAFEDLLEQRLTRHSGWKRRTAVIPTGEIIDTYGRLLAYIAPWFEGGPNDPLPSIDPRR